MKIENLKRIGKVKTVIEKNRKNKEKRGKRIKIMRG